MLIQLIKSVHIVLAMSLMGMASYCLLHLFTNKFKWTKGLVLIPMVQLNKMMLVLALFALASGMSLVIPKHYTFDTPWIKAALLLLPTFILSLLFVLFYKSRLIHKEISPLKQGFLCLAYVFLLSLLVLLVRDAVTKSTFILF